MLEKAHDNPVKSKTGATQSCNKLNLSPALAGSFSFQLIIGIMMIKGVVVSYLKTWIICTDSLTCFMLRSSVHRSSLVPTPCHGMQPHSPPVYSTWKIVLGRWARTVCHTGTRRGCYIMKNLDLDLFNFIWSVRGKDWKQKQISLWTFPFANKIGMCTNQHIWSLERCHFFSVVLLLSYQCFISNNFNKASEKKKKKRMRIQY